MRFPVKYVLSHFTDLSEANLKLSRSIMFRRILLLFIGLYGFIGVALGAIAAHIIKDAAAISLIEKGTFYHLIHTIALLAIRNESSKLWHVVQAFWMAGIFIFSASLYLKAFAITVSSPLAPFGGALLMAGWVCIPFTQKFSVQSK